MYQLFLDVGNTSIVMGLYQAETLQGTGRVASDENKTSDQYYDLIVDFLKPYNVTFADLTDFVIGSVVPNLTHTLSTLWQEHQNKEPFIIHGGFKTNLQIQLEDPNELGSDLLAGAVAAHAAYPDTNVIVVDMGTATTMMLVTKDGFFHGGSIVAGVELMLDALIDNTALLSFTKEIESADIKAIGISTETAIASGLVYGYTGLVDNIIANMVSELGTDDYKVIATGGQATIIAKHSKFLDTYDPNLIFKGMQIIYNKNKV